MPDPFTIRIFVPDGDPEGVRLIDRMNWTGLGIAFPRSRWMEVRQRSEFNRAGDEDFAAEGIPWYPKDGRISAKGIVQFTARYHFWSYAICRKPGYHVAGHFEWGYTTRLDLNHTPYAKTEQEPIRWIPNL